MSRVVVLGGGLGGLAVAARLARMRHEVTLVERGDEVGGMAAVCRQDGYTFDTGPCFLTLPAAARDLFLKTGKALETVVDLQPIEPMTRVRFDDGTPVDVPSTGPAGVAAAFEAALGPAAGRDWLRFVDRCGKTWESVRGPLLEEPDSRAPLSTRLPWRTLQRSTHRGFRDPRLRALVESFAIADGADPRRAAATFAVLPYLEHTFRPWRVVGGFHRLVDALHERVVERHVTVVTGTPVTAVTTSAGRVDGVRLGGDRAMAAEVVVSAIDATSLADLLPDDVAESATRAVPSGPSWFVLLLGLTARTDLPPRTLLLGGGDEVASLFDAGSPVTDPTMHVWTAPDADAAPPGGQAVTVAVRAPRQGRHDWTPQATADYTRVLLDRLAARGYDVREQVATMRAISPADLELRTGVPGGAVHGWAGPASRPANRTSLPGLFLVGASTRPGGGVAPTLLSAAHVAEAIGRD